MYAGCNQYFMVPFHLHTPLSVLFYFRYCFKCNLGHHQHFKCGWIIRCASKQTLYFKKLSHHGSFSFLFEDFRPEIRQYFIESDQDALPFSRMQRSLVYQRAKTKMQINHLDRLSMSIKRLPLYGAFTGSMPTCGYQKFSY